MKLLVLVIVLVTASCVVGDDDEDTGPDTRTLFERLELDEEVRNYINEEMKATNIRELLREITSKTHLAGSAGEKELADNIAAKWRSYGLDDVKVLPYSAALSGPDYEHPSTIRLVNKRTGEILHQAALKEPNLDGNQADDIVPPFNAYSATGNPKGDMIFVNFGRIEDFLRLKKLGVQIKGRICIAKYGRIYRGDKVKFAQRFGAIGMILYTDPANYAPDKNGTVYPHSIYMPGSGVQRGTVAVGGDALTPGYPGIEGAYFSKDKYNNDIDRDILPKIPVHPIGYTDAQVFLRALKGRRVPKEWAGGLPIVYRLGGSFTDPDVQMEMDITTVTDVKTTHNVVGVIKGTVEPDRYVIIGSHYDAWVFGAVDPGLATLLETARVFAQLRKSGWKPRRTLVFAAWGAEEPGTIGSLEFVENFANILHGRAVAYINCDVTMYGTYRLSADGLPLLFDTIKDAAKRVPNPNATESDLGRSTVFDTWDFTTNSSPQVHLMGAGSDHADFIGKIGVTCASVAYVTDPKSLVSFYPLYHSAYETFHLQSVIMDPTFEYHLATGRVFSQLAYSLLDSALLPLHVITYAEHVTLYHVTLLRNHEQLMRKHHLGRALDLLKRSVDRFAEACKLFDAKLKYIDEEDDLKMRMHNDVLMQLERNFIDPLGLPGRPFDRNILYAPSQHNSYASSSFPGISDAMFDIESYEYDHLKRWNLVAKQISVVMTFIQSGADLLNSLGTF